MVWLTVAKKVAWKVVRMGMRTVYEKAELSDPKMVD